MSDGPKGPSLELAGPAKAVTVGGQLNLGLSTILTLPLVVLNPVKLLKTVTQLVGGSKGPDMLSKGTEIAGQFMGLLKASPKMFLKGAGKQGNGAAGAVGAVGDAATKFATTKVEQGSNFLGKGIGAAIPIPVVGMVVGKTIATTGKLTAMALKTASSIVQSKFNDLLGGPKGAGGLAKGVGKAAGMVGKSIGSTAEKGINDGSDAVGRGAGNAAKSGLANLGSAISPIPLVGWVCGPILVASAPVANTAIRTGAKVASRTTSKLLKSALATALKTVAKTITKTAVSTVRSTLRTTLQAGIQAAQKRGNCKMVGRRSVHLKQQRPSVINPLKFANTLAARLRVQVQRILQLKGKFKAIGRRLVPLSVRKPLASARKVLGATAGFGYRAARSGAGAFQATASTTIKLSDSAKNLSHGDAHAAAKDLQAGASAGKGALRNAVAPGREILGKAWGRRKDLGKALGGAVRPLSRPLHSHLRRVKSQVSGPGTRVGAVLGRARQVGQALRSVKTTVQRPFKAVHQAALPVLKVARGVSRTIQKPVKVARVGLGVGSDVFSAGKALGTAPMDLSKGAQALAAKGDAGAALSHAHQASQSVTALPDAASSTLGRFQGRGGSPGPSPNPHHPETSSPEADIPSNDGGAQPPSPALAAQTPTVSTHHSSAGRSLWGRKKG